ncbi:HupE/UreJ family protein [Noviherbaspirillum aerium]|uniref:HupE/UreJ family protein n=1 Tax=Noviherbaspirillum aerium TaxID=2588497 RepID=UPI00298F77AA|nr:HupE/UreJ family protein [Noviherbaspirillum aerium]
MMLARFLMIVISALSWGLMPSAHAHKPSDSYLSLSTSDAKAHEVRGQWDIALRDLEHAVGIDGNGDGELTWSEIRDRHADIAAYALSRLSLKAGGSPCRAAPTAHLIDHHSDGAYAVLRFSATCEQAVNALDIEYRLLFDLDPQHRGLLKFAQGGQGTSAIFSPDQPSIRVDAAGFGPLAQFIDYFGHGVWHIWIGFDHILFLISLLLPAVLVFHQRQWQSADRLRPAVTDVLKVVTAFTLAHSITLSLAALELVSLPTRWVESAIAASVVIAAVNNLVPFFQGQRWIAAFVFGLVHGFGFASVLGDLGLPQSALLLSLVGFNLGVEIGQLAIVAAFLPLAYGLRKTWLYRRAIFVGGSAAIALLASVWLVERAFEVNVG